MLAEQVLWDLNAPVPPRVHARPRIGISFQERRRVSTRTHRLRVHAAMGQTKAGAKTNEWLSFMQGCRAAYREHKASLPPKPHPRTKATRKQHRVAAALPGPKHIRCPEHIPHTKRLLTLDAYAVVPPRCEHAEPARSSEQLVAASPYQNGGLEQLPSAPLWQDAAA